MSHETAQKSLFLETLKNFIAGTTSGFSGKLVEYPFDTVKVLLQTQDPAKPSYTGSIHCFFTTWRNHGIRGLYRGLLTPLLGSAMENAALFTSYGWIKSTVAANPNKLSFFELVLCGIGTGVSVGFVLTPVELVKCRLQVQQSVGAQQRYRNPMDVITQTLKSEGIIGMYRGHTSTLAREIPGNVAWFGMYDLVCTLLTPKGGSKNDINTLGHMLAGASAGVSYWSAFFPADVAKSKIQTDPALSTEPLWRVSEYFVVSFVFVFFLCLTLTSLCAAQVE
eukprot:c2288_g1_i1.p1 GENE.c2288_g1_i1~~c2288_g1_i1.p1  ORF type:complete len:279 (-),score=17.69 c2288_g1_i1:230-1066(-)